MTAILAIILLGIILPNFLFLTYWITRNILLVSILCLKYKSFKKGWNKYREMWEPFVSI